MHHRRSCPLLTLTTSHPPIHANPDTSLASVQGEHNDTLGLLVAHLCFQQDLLPQLFASLGPSPVPEGQAHSGCAAPGAQPGGDVLQPTMAQAALLELLCAEAQDLPQAAPAPG